MVVLVGAAVTVEPIPLEGVKAVVGVQAQVVAFPLAVNVVLAPLVMATSEPALTEGVGFTVTATVLVARQLFFVIVKVA